MNVTRQIQMRTLIAMASILLLFACSKVSNRISENAVQKTVLILR